MDGSAAHIVFPRTSTRVKANPRRTVAADGQETPEPGSCSRALANLTPGFRDRLIERLVAMGLPADRRVSFVADLTGRATQTVRRWFAGSDPGLPDLRSFARLCSELNISADDVIGLDQTDEPHAGAGEGPLLEVARCVHAMARELGWKGRPGGAVRVPGDEMAPQLREGDLAFVDEAGGFTGNGLYAFECQGQFFIRRLEQQLGRGWRMKCDNKAYAGSELDEASAANVPGLRLLGRVRGTIAMRVF